MMTENNVVEQPQEEVKKTKPDIKPEYLAGKGKVWVCSACGKTSKTKNGIHGYGRVASGWDESCYINSYLADEDQLLRNEHGRVVLDKSKPRV